MKKRKILSILLLSILILLCTCSLNAQRKKPVYILQGNSLKAKEVKSNEPVKTVWTLKIKDTVYPVWKTKRGSYYILRTSKKTGSNYKQYIEIIDPLKGQNNEKEKDSVSSN